MTRKNRNNMMGGAKMPAVGSKLQVWNGNAKHTSGGLTRKDLMRTKHGRIVSRKKHAAGQKAIKNLRKAGYIARKGTFKLFRKKRGGSDAFSDMMPKMGGSASSFADMMKGGSDAFSDMMKGGSDAFSDMMPKMGGRRRRSNTFSDMMPKMGGRRSDHFTNMKGGSASSAGDMKMKGGRRSESVSGFEGAGVEDLQKLIQAASKQ